MARGHKDWGISQETDFETIVQDLGELAVRIGSVVTYSRTGNVIYLDEFEGSLAPYNEFVGGLGNARSISTDRSFRGLSSLKIIGGSTNVLLTTGVSKAIPNYDNGNLGMEFHFRDFTEATEVHFGLRVLDGVNRQDYFIALGMVSKEVAYLNSSGNLQVLGTFPFNAPSQNAWFAVKLYIDRTNKEYLRLRVNSTLFDMEGITMFENSDTIAPVVEARIWLPDIVGDNPIVYYDDLIITTQEI